MDPHGYEEVEHTADLAIRIWGEDFYSLLKYAAKGLYDLMGCVAKPGSQIESNFFVASGDPESIIVDFLDELLHRCEFYDQVFESFTFNDTDDGLTIEASGHELDSIIRYIKAVTFHELNIQATQNGLEATLTFDV